MIVVLVGFSFGSGCLFFLVFVLLVFVLSFLCWFVGCAESGRERKTKRTLRHARTSMRTTKTYTKGRKIDRDISSCFENVRNFERHFRSYSRRVRTAARIDMRLHGLGVSYFLLFITIFVLCFCLLVPFGGVVWRLKGPRAKAAWGTNTPTRGEQKKEPPNTHAYTQHQPRTHNSTTTTRSKRGGRMCVWWSNMEGYDLYVSIDVEDLLCCVIFV